MMKFLSLNKINKLYFFDSNLLSATHQCNKFCSNAVHLKKLLHLDTPSNWLL